MDVTAKLDDILTAMQSWVGDQDKEIAHGEADDLLLDALIVLATKVSDEDSTKVVAIVEAWKQVGKWYA